MNPAAFAKKKLRSLTQRFRPQGLILLYHRVAEQTVDPWELCVSPANFAEHLAVLKKFRPTPLAQLVESVRSASVAVTFDDGYADNLHTAVPLLQQHEIPATFFLTTGYLGGNREFWWDELERRLTSAAADARQTSLPAYYEIYDLLQPLPDAARRQVLSQIPTARSIESPRDSHRALTIEEVSRLAAIPLMEIGAHTVTHPRLSAHAACEQLAEMRESKRFLEAAAGRSINSFSYPFGGAGHYSSESVQMARQAGFTCACTTTPSAVERHSSRFELPRLVIGNIPGDRFEHLLNSYIVSCPGSSMKNSVWGGRPVRAGPPGPASDSQQPGPTRASAADQGVRPTLSDLLHEPTGQHNTEPKLK